MHDIQGQVNTQFVLDELREFNRLQTMKDVTIKSAEILNAKQNYGIEEVTELWQSCLDLDRADSPRELPLSAFDIEAVFARARLDEVFASWHRRTRSASRRPGAAQGAAADGGHRLREELGSDAFRQGRRGGGKVVLYVTLEMPVEDVFMRFWQGWFAGKKWESDDATLTRFVKDSDGTLTAIEREEFEPELCLQHEARGARLAEQQEAGAVIPAGYRVIGRTRASTAACTSGNCAVTRPRWRECGGCCANCTPTRSSPTW